MNYDAICAQDRLGVGEIPGNHLRTNFNQQYIAVDRLMVGEAYRQPGLTEEISNRVDTPHGVTPNTTANGNAE
jgi:hypothetical protein